MHSNEKWCSIICNHITPILHPYPNKNKKIWSSQTKPNDHTWSIFICHTCIQHICSHTCMCNICIIDRHIIYFRIYFHSASILSTTITILNVVYLCQIPISSHMWSIVWKRTTCVCNAQIFYNIFFFFKTMLVCNWERYSSSLNSFIIFFPTNCTFTYV